MSQDRDFDLVIYGATGFTGRQAAERIAALLGDRRPWAIAGRNAAKLELVKNELKGGGRAGVIVAEAGDAEALRKMAARAKVILSTAGPFALYGDRLVEACVLEGCHYVDITGETPWVRSLIDRFHEPARERGLRIVPCCGFDSVPAELGVLLLVEAMKKSSLSCGPVKAAYRVRGGFNGGTLASALQMARAGQLRQLGDPILLNPAELQSSERRKKEPRDRRKLSWDADFQAWLGPFLMEAVNSRIVRRSAALAELAGQGYGGDFSYCEAMDLGRGAKAWLMGSGMLAGLGSFQMLAGAEWGRRIIERMVPAPGEGPSVETMDNGRTAARFVARASDGSIWKAELYDKGDPGNRFTVKALTESALALIENFEDLPTNSQSTGIVTPARAFGEVLIRRLRGAGVKLELCKE